MDGACTWQTREKNIYILVKETGEKKPFGTPRLI
jgi:hypothetical protein